MAWVRTVVIQGFISMSNLWTPHDLVLTRALESPEPSARRRDGIPGALQSPTHQREVLALPFRSWRWQRAVVAPRYWREWCVALTWVLWEVVPWQSQAMEVVFEELVLPLVPLVWFWWHCPALLADCVLIPEFAPPAVCPQGTQPWWCSGIFVFPAEGHWIPSVLVPYRVNRFASEKSKGRTRGDLLLPECSLSWVFWNCGLI